MNEGDIDAVAVARERLALDAPAEVARIASTLREQVVELLHRRGLVIAMSGGVDSSVCAALAVEALGPRRVHGLIMPERDSEPASRELAEQLARQLGITFEVEQITPILDACGCYQRRNDAIREAVPDFGDDWRCKIVLQGAAIGSGRLNVYYVATQPPGGETTMTRLSASAYLAIVAATNFKQRVRKMLEYHHADRLHYAVTGTPNRLEYDQGFFVKGGDGLADVKPIAHLYKTQVYQLAEHLGIPATITSRPPTTDTYSLPQSQEEFFFALPLPVTDLLLQAFNQGRTPQEAGASLGITPGQVAHVFADFAQKRVTTRYLHHPPLLVESIPLAARHGST